MPAQKASYEIMYQNDSQRSVFSYCAGSTDQKKVFATFIASLLSPIAMSTRIFHEI